MALGQSNRVGENRRREPSANTGSLCFLRTAAELGVIDKEFGQSALL